MSLKITKIEDGNDDDSSKECITIKALDDINLGGYAIVDKTFTEDNEVSNIFRHIYRFPDINIKKGDYIKLYSGKGQYIVRRSVNRKNKIYKFYWNSDDCIWNNGKAGDTAILIHYRVIDSLKKPNSNSSVI